SPKIFRLLRVELIAVRYLSEKLWSSGGAYLLRATDGSTYPVGAGSKSEAGAGSTLVEAMPEQYAEYWRTNFQSGLATFCVRCIAGKGVKRLRHSVGYLNYTDDGLVFVTRR